jgi:hypothetical protein
MFAFGFSFNCIDNFESIKKYSDEQHPTIISNKYFSVVSDLQLLVAKHILAF